MHKIKPVLPFNEGEQYRAKLLTNVFEKTLQARSLIDAYKALCLCVLVDTMDDYQTPEFMYDLVLENFYGDVYEGFDQNIIDDAIDLARDMDGYEAFNDNGPYEHALFKRGDFPTMDSHQTWIYYLPNIIFYQMGLCLNGRIPSTYDSNEPHIFDTYNKSFSNKVLEKKLEIADYMNEILEPVTQAMMEFLKNRLDIQEDCEPSDFLQVVKDAKSEGYDISMPLRSDFQYSWFDRFWPDAVRDVVRTQINTDNDKSPPKWDFDFPDDVVLQ